MGILEVADSVLLLVELEPLEPVLITENCRVCQAQV